MSYRKILVTKIFIDGVTSRQYGAGEWTVDERTANRFVENGRAIYADDLGDKRPQNEEKPESKGNQEPASKTSSEEPAASTRAIKGIPKDFPERELLMSNGFKSMADLKAEDAIEKIEAIEGMTKAKVKKIGLALAG